MSIDNKSLKTIAGIAAAGKLSFASHTVHADFSDGSKASQLSISQGDTWVMVPNDDGGESGRKVSSLLEIIQDSSNQVTPKGEDSRGQSKSTTTIYPGEINLDVFEGAVGEYVEEQLIVSGLNSKDGGTLDVYLVMSSGESDGLDWDDTASGFLLIDRFDFEILGKATVDVIDLTIFPNSLASIGFNSDSIGSGSRSFYPSISFSIPIKKDNVNVNFFKNNKIYIQSIAFPAGTIKWDDAVVSSLYTFSLTESDTEVEVPNKK